MMEVSFKQLSPIEWDAERGDVDFHIRLEQDNYVIDVFDSCYPDAHEACLTSFTCETWEQVERYCREYDGVTVV